MEKQVCPFCDVKSIPSLLLMNVGNWFVIRDKYPSAPVHYLVVYKQCKATLQQIPSYEVSEGMHALIGFAGLRGIKDYRIRLNNGPDSGQAIPHIHFHLLSQYENNPL